MGLTDGFSAVIISKETKKQRTWFERDYYGGREQG